MAKEKAAKVEAKQQKPKSTCKVRSLCRIEQETWDWITATVGKRAAATGRSKTDIWIEALTCMAHAGFDCSGAKFKCLQ